MVHSHFTLCMRARDYVKRLSQHPWYNLWMGDKGPHHYKVTALGSCVKSPSILNIVIQDFTLIPLACETQLNHYDYKMHYKYIVMKL